MSKEIEIKKQIEELIKTDKHWKVAVLGKKLLCPNCASIMAVISDNIGEIIDEIYKHLTNECPNWKGFDAEYIPLDELKLEAFKLGLATNLRYNPVYKLKDNFSNWFCPFSAKLSGIIIKDDEPLTKSKVQEILDYILNQPEFHERKMMPFELLYLQTKINFFTHPSYQIRSSSSKLINPYDGLEFDIEIPENYQPDEEIWEKVYNILKSQDHFAQKESKFKSETELVHNVQVVKLVTKLTEIVKVKITSERNWQQWTPYKTWICPFCGSNISNVKPDSDNIAILNLNSKSIAKHLVYVCEPMKGKLKNALDDELEMVLNNHIKMRPTPEPEDNDADEGYEPIQFDEEPEGNEPIAIDNQNNAIETVEIKRNEPLSIQTQQVSLDPVEYRRHTTKSLVSKKTDKDSLIQTAHKGLLGHVKSPLTKMMSNRDFEKKQDEHRRILDELREKQMRILPEPPDIEGIEISVVYQPCDVVGGDFYDFLKLKNGKLGIIQGDVSGHGAEVFGDVTMTMKTLRIYGKQSDSPREMLINANDDLVPDLTSKTFVSVYYAILDIETFEITIARAGHNPLIIYNPERDDPFLVVEPQGMVIGMVSGTMFENSLKQVTLQLYSGDMLLLFTDGITETMNPEGEEYGMEKLKELIEKYGQDEADTLNNSIMAELESYRRGGLADDDITMIAIKIL